MKTDTILTLMAIMVLVPVTIAENLMDTTSLTPIHRVDNSKKGFANAIVPTGNLFVPYNLNLSVGNSTGSDINHTNIIMSSAFGNFSKKIANFNMLVIDQVGNAFRIPMGAFFNFSSSLNGLELLKNFGNTDLPNKTNIAMYQFTTGKSVDGSIFVQQTHPGVIFNSENYSFSLNLINSDSIFNPYMGFGKHGFGFNYAIDSSQTIQVGSFWNNALKNPSEWGFYELTHSLTTTMIFGFAAQYSYEFKPYTFSINGGMVYEDSNYLGTSSEGIFSIKDSTTSFIGFDGNYSNDGFRVFGGINFGYTKINPYDKHLITNASFITSSFHVGVSKDFDNDSVGFVVSQPLRVESGAMSLNIPDTVGVGGIIQSNQKKINFSADAREIDFQAFFKTSLLDNDKLLIGGMYRVNPSNSTTDKNDFIGMIRYKVTF